MSVSDHDQDHPMKGCIVVLRNGMRGEIIGVVGEGSYREAYEILIDGTRCYVEANEVKVLGVLDRIARAISD